MGKRLTDPLIDAIADAMAANLIEITITSAEPATADLIEGVKLADVVIDGTDFTKADGDTSGRKTTIQAQNGMSVANTGTATHVVAHAGVLVGSDMWITTCASTALNAGGTVNLAAYKFEAADIT